MAKLFLIDEEAGLYEFYCPGCGYDHSFRTKPYSQDGRKWPVWTFNGDIDAPTFSPSLLVNGDMPEHRCHLFLERGKIRYLQDCHHELAGKTVECPEWED